MPAEGGAALLFDFADLACGLLQCLADRGDEVGDSLLPFSQFRLCAFLVARQVLLGQPQEGVAVPGERVASQPAECGGEPLLRLAQCRCSFAGQRVLAC